MPDTLLAGLTPGAFLRSHWQKRPLLARGALPCAAGLLTRDELFRLAGRDDTQARLVTRRRRRWQLAHGPFTRRSLERLPARDWTLLVQGVNHVLPRADALLRNFSFLPYARLDDVMVSYAPPGGSVGPHFDSYDVFLLQIEGVRRWRISTQRDLGLVESAPLRLLRRFRAEREWRLAPGDMLYLPPRCAHEGVALDHCLTASIGFRAPHARELGARFLEFLADRLTLDGLYSDPGLRPSLHPARIGADMLAASCRTLHRIRWSRRTVVELLGCHLTEPKPHVFFEPPAPPLPAAAFFRRIARHGIRLDSRTLMLYYARRIFINGSPHAATPPAAAILRQLADRRELPPAVLLDSAAAGCLYQWYRAGYIQLGGPVRAHARA